MGNRNENYLKSLQGAPKEPLLQGDAKILYDAFVEFSKGGVTRDEKVKLNEIDAVLKDASIQLTKNGDAIIVDNDGNVTRVRPR